MDPSTSVVSATVVMFLIVMMIIVAVIFGVLIVGFGLLVAAFVMGVKGEFEAEPEAVDPDPATVERSVTNNLN